MRCKEHKRKVSDLNREQTEHGFENDNALDEWGEVKKRNGISHQPC